MDIAAELTRMFGLESASQVSQGGEVFGQGGYLSFRRSATISKEGSEPLHVFIKSSDVSRSELDKLQQISNHFCRTECVFYGLMGPVLNSVIGQYDIEPVFPRAFGQKISDQGTILVMEDMTKQGFSLVKQDSFGIEQAYCVVKAMARAQAAFWIARVNFNYTLDSMLFNPASPFIERLKRSGVDYGPVVEPNVEYFYKNLGRYVNSTDDEKLLLDCMRGLMEAIIAYPSAGGMPHFTDAPVGLVHGDLWFSNFMFKGEGDTMTCRLFDWQFWGVGLFGFDLGVLMISSLTTEMLKQHIDKIPVLFYRTFKDIYETRTGNPVPFTEEAALNNMQYALFHALFWVIVGCHLQWESGHTDVSVLLANMLFALRSGRISAPF